jgi:hypothetical protein
MPQEGTHVIPSTTFVVLSPAHSGRNDPKNGILRKFFDFKDIPILSSKTGGLKWLDTAIRK